VSASSTSGERLRASDKTPSVIEVLRINAIVLAKSGRAVLPASLALGQVSNA